MITISNECLIFFNLCCLDRDKWDRDNLAVKCNLTFPVVLKFDRFF